MKMRGGWDQSPNTGGATPTPDAVPLAGCAALTGVTGQRGESLDYGEWTRSFVLSLSSPAQHERAPSKITPW